MNESYDPLTELFQLNPNYRLQWEEAQQCHVLLYPEGLVKLSDTAVEILRRCKHPQTGNDVIAQLQQDYPDATTLADDVAEFLQHAQRQEWIMVIPNSQD